MKLNLLLCVLLMLVLFSGCASQPFNNPYIRWDKKLIPMNYWEPQYYKIAGDTCYA